MNLKAYRERGRRSVAASTLTAAGVILLVIATSGFVWLNWDAHPAYRAVFTFSFLGSGIFMVLGNRMAAAETRLIESELRRSCLFEQSGIAFWEQDWSAVLHHLSAKSPIDRDLLLGGEAEQVDVLVSMIRVVAANRSALELVDACTPPGTTATAMPLVGNSIARAAIRAFLSGESGFEAETQVFSDHACPVHLVLSFAFSRGRSRGGNVLVSAVDISAYKADRPESAMTPGFNAETEDHRLHAILVAAITDGLSEPLSAIQISGEASARWLQARTPDLEEIARSIEIVRSAARRSAQAVRYARNLLIGPGGTLETMSVSDILKEATAFLRDQLAQREIRTVLHIEDDLPEVTMYRFDLQRAIITLIIGAIEALEKCSVVERTITIAASRIGLDEVQVAIDDNAAVGTDAVGFAEAASTDITFRRHQDVRNSIVSYGGSFRILRIVGVGSSARFTLAADSWNACKLEVEVPSLVARKALATVDIAKTVMSGRPMALG